MAKLALLNILLFLLVAAGSSIAWPSYFDDAERDTLSAELEKETDRHAVANSYYQYDDAEVATYGDNADTADDDDNMATAAHNQHNIAEINWRRHRRPKNKNKKPKKG